MAIQDNLNAIEGLAEVQEDIANIEEELENGGFLNKENGEDILLQDSIEGNLIDFKAYGRSSQDGTPTPDAPIDIASVGDKGYFDGELLQGAYAGTTGIWNSTNLYVCNKNMIPCNVGDNIKLEYGEAASQLMILYYDSNKNFISYVAAQATSVLESNVIKNACYFNINIGNDEGIATTTAKHICVTINGMYALIVKNVNKNLWEFGDVSGTTSKIITLGKALPQGTYTLSSLVTSSDTDSTKNRIVLYSEDLQQSLNVDIGRNTRTSTTFTTTFDVKTIRFWGGSGSSASSGDTFAYADIQLEFGNTMTTYVPHEEQTTYIPITEPLRSVGEVKDEISCIDGVYGITRRISKVVIDENSTISTGSNSGISMFIVSLGSALGGVSPYNNGLCTHLVYERTVLSENNKNNVVSVYKNGDLCFRMDKFATVDELKAWLAENPIEVIYEFATPYFEPFEDQTPFANIATFENITCISATDSPELEVVYYRNNAGGKKIAELDSNSGWRIFRTAGDGAGSGGASFATSDIKYRKIGKTLEIIGTMTEFKPFQGSSIVFTCEDGDIYDIKSDIAHIFTIPAYDSEGNIYLVDITYNGIALYIKRHTHSTNQYDSVTLQNINIDILITI